MTDGPTGNVTVLPTAPIDERAEMAQDIQAYQALAQSIAPRLSPIEAISETAGTLHKQPVFIAGSVVAAEAHGLTDYSDVDVFTPTQQVLVSAVQIMLDNGYVMDERFARTWFRWLRYGMKGWHTNSIKLESKTGVQVNVVFKLTEGHATTSLSQVLESFDFGLLGVGLEVESNTLRDLRPYLFPKYGMDEALPMMPNKRENWRLGFISQYNGLREAGRYAKYHSYGYDMSAVKDDLVTGYEQGSIYYLNHFDEDKRLLGEIYLKLADSIRNDRIVELSESYKMLNFTDSLDKIFEGLE